jgi:hypothetical protein
LVVNGQGIVPMLLYQDSDILMQVLIDFELH